MSEKLISAIKSDVEEIDTEKEFDNYLNSTYPDLEIAGHSFDAAFALRELDPTAYDVDFADWLDGESYVEINGNYYEQDACEEIKDGLINDLESELDALEDERAEELEKESDNEEPDEELLDSLNDKINDLNDEIIELKAYTF